MGSISADELEPVCRRWGDCDDVDPVDELLEDDDELSASRRPARGGLESPADDDSPDVLDVLDEESSLLRRPARGGLELSLPDDDKFEEEDVASRRWLAPEDEESESEASDLDEADPDEVDVSFWRRSLVPADPDSDEVEPDDPV